ncbi:MAG: hypothetical protein LBM70_08570 [Victivallales bacterium]|jgi:hypothetical protein|nr:hypothetical protein [Victivallales bacterium]
MNMSKIFKSGLILLAFCMTFGVFAAPWISNGPKRDVVTLVIAGNYKSPRLMAELILNESRQPYLLLPTPTSKMQKIIFVKAKGPAQEIAVQSLKQFVDFLNPRRIVVLGDERYVQMKYIKLLDRSIPIIFVTGDDWVRLAEETTYLLNLSHLGDNYKRLHEELMNKGKFIRPTPRTNQKPGNTPAEPQGELMAVPEAESAPAVEEIVVIEEVVPAEATPAESAK